VHLFLASRLIFTSLWLNLSRDSDSGSTTGLSGRCFGACSTPSPGSGRRLAAIFVRGDLLGGARRLPGLGWSTGGAMTAPPPRPGSGVGWRTNSGDWCSQMLAGNRTL